MSRIRLSETELINLIEKAINEKRGTKGKLKDREVSKHDKTPCDTYVPSGEYSAYCDWETTGMIWDPTECECVPLIF